MDEDSNSIENRYTSSRMSDLYKRYRPVYPQGIYDVIIAYMKEKLQPPYSLAVDVACGSGQNTFSLAQHFGHVIGIDVSPSQVEEGEKDYNRPSNVTMKVGNAFNLPFDSNAASLVTVATAAHWFHPIEDFYREAHRTLAENGCLAIFGYETLRSCGSSTSSQLDNAIEEFFNLYRVVRKDKWLDLSGLYNNCVSDESLAIKLQWTVSDILNYASSWSGYQKSVPTIKQGTNSDPLQILKLRLLEFCHEDYQYKFQLKMPLYLTIGRK